MVAGLPCWRWGRALSLCVLTNCFFLTPPPLPIPQCAFPGCSCAPESPPALCATPAPESRRAPPCSRSRPAHSHRTRDSRRAPSLLLHSAPPPDLASPTARSLPVPNLRPSPCLADNPLRAAGPPADPFRTSQTIPSFHESESAGPAHTR